MQVTSHFIAIPVSHFSDKTGFIKVEVRTPGGLTKNDSS